MKNALKVYSDVNLNVGTIYLYGEIGEIDWNDETNNLTALEVVKTLTAMKAVGVTRVNVRINSRGGYMSEGLAIITALQQSDIEIHTFNDGYAMSMAADIFLAVPLENRHMAKNATLMIHAPVASVYGNAADLRKAADQLDQLSETTIKMMAISTGKSEEEIRTSFYDYVDHALSYDDCVQLNLVTNDPTTIVSPQKKGGFWETIKKIFNHKNEEDTQNQEDMKIEDIQKAVAEGKLQIGDLKTVVENAEKAAKPETPLTLEAIVNAVSQKNKEDLDAFKAQIEIRLSKSDAQPPRTEGSTDADAQFDPANAKKTADDVEFEKFNEQLIKQHHQGR